MKKRPYRVPGAPLVIPYFKTPDVIRSRRQYVMWTKRARDILVKFHGWPAADFIRIADHEPSMNLSGFYPKHWGRDYGYGSIWAERLPRGAVLYWPDGNDMCGEAYDPQDPILMLKDIQYWEKDFIYSDDAYL